MRLERKLLTAQPDDHEVREPYGLRVGWSVAVSSLLLGKNEVFFIFIVCRCDLLVKKLLNPSGFHVR